VIALLLIGAVLFVFSERKELFPGYGLEVRIATVALLVILGWALARSLGQGMGPALYRRLEPGTAGTIGFLVRLLTIGLVVVIALRIAGLKPGTLAVGGAFTAVILGLAAQQVLGNLLAGVVNGADRILVPNGILLQCAVTPLREPERVELRARIDAGTSPREVQERLERQISVPLRYPPHIAVEELDRNDVIVRIVSTPLDPRDGAKLAEEILAGVHATDGARAAPEDDSTG
jgi:small conductance mechanosensitive channel